MPYAFELEIITSSTRLKQALGEWNAFIASQDAETGVFSDPLVIERSVDFGAGQQAVLVACSESGRTVGLIPFRFSRRRLGLAIGAWRIGSVAANVLKLLDSDFPVRRGKERLAILAGARAAIRQQTPCDLMIAEEFRVGDADRPWSGAVRQEGGLQVRNVQRTLSTIALPEDFETYFSGLGALARRNLKRALKKLEGSSGNDLVLARYSEAGAMEELSAHAAGIWGKSWHGKAGGGKPPSTDLLKSLAQAGWVRSYVLLVKGEPIAYIVGFQYKATYYYASIAYDAKWRPHSPGVVINYLMLQDLFKSDRPAVVDFGFGYNEFKEQLGNRPEDRAEIWMPLSSHGEAVLLCIAALQRVYRAGKAAASKLGLAAKLRNLRRGAPSGPEKQMGFRARLQRVAQRIRIQGIGQTLNYVLGNALLERLGIRITRVFEAVEADAARVTAKGLKVAMLKDMASLTPADLEALKSYGGPRLLRQFEAGFARHEACAAGRRDGKLAGVVWLAAARDYVPANRPECALIERCFTLPEHRGLGVFPALLACAVNWNREQHPERGAPYVECSVSNASSAHGILKAGFKPVGVLITAWRRQYFRRRRPSGVRELQGDGQR